MRDIILNFSNQFSFKPQIKNVDNLVTSFTKVVVGGMGGSHLAGEIIKTLKPEMSFSIYSDYGLPILSEEDFKKTLFVAISHSGNTEETFSFAEAVFERGGNLAIISTGGKLLSFADDKKIPFIKTSMDALQPRFSLGFLINALSKILGDIETSLELDSLKNKLHPIDFEAKGMNLSQSLFEKIPLIYTSRKNASIGYIWKIKFNETAKIPAFCNVFPELNHNEMESFDLSVESQKLSENFLVIFINDDTDTEKIKKRMEITRGLLQKRGIKTIEIKLKGESFFERMFNSLILADWVSYYIALSYKRDPQTVPLIEEFKKLIS